MPCFIVSAANRYWTISECSTSAAVVSSDTRSALVRTVSSAIGVLPSDLTSLLPQASDAPKYGADCPGPPGIRRKAARPWGPAPGCQATWSAPSRADSRAAATAPIDTTSAPSEEATSSGAGKVELSRQKTPSDGEQLLDTRREAARHDDALRVVEAAEDARDPGERGAGALDKGAGFRVTCSGEVDDGTRRHGIRWQGAQRMARREGARRHGLAGPGLETVPGSTLHLYRQALRLRRPLLAGEDLEWRGTGRSDVLRFGRHPGWEVMTNFGAIEVPLGGGEVLLSSGPVPHDVLPAETTVWLAPPG